MQLLQRHRKPHHPHTHIFHDWVTTADKKELDWAASGWAGLAGGGALLLWELALAPVFNGITPAELVRQVAAIALGESVLPPLTPFTGLVGLTAMVVHLPLSLIYARLLAGVIHGMRTRPSLAFGAAFGAVLYFVNFYAFTAFFPWFQDLRGDVTFAGHVVYGLTAAAVYEGLLHAKD